MSSIRVIESGNEDALAEAVQIEGPVTVSIDHQHRPFQVSIYSQCYTHAQKTVSHIRAGVYTKFCKAIQPLSDLQSNYMQCMLPQFYREGVYSDNSCSINPRNATHEMVVVGYGTDSTYGPYWIVKNRSVVSPAINCRYYHLFINFSYQKKIMFLLSCHVYMQLWYNVGGWWIYKDAARRQHMWYSVRRWLPCTLTLEYCS